MYQVGIHIQGRPKNGLFLRVNNFMTFNGRKACNVSKVSFWLEQEYYLHVSNLNILWLVCINIHYPSAECLLKGR